MVGCPFRAGDTRVPDGCAEVPARPALGTPAQTQCKCPFLAHQLAGSPAARRRRGLICIEVTRTRPIAAPQSCPGNFQKAPAPHSVRESPSSTARTRSASNLSSQGSLRAESRVNSSLGPGIYLGSLPLQGRGQRGAPSWNGLPLPQATDLRASEGFREAATTLPSPPLLPTPEGLAELSLGDPRGGGEG